MATRKKRTKRKKSSTKNSATSKEYSVFAGKGNLKYASTRPVNPQFGQRKYQ